MPGVLASRVKGTISGLVVQEREAAGYVILVQDQGQYALRSGLGKAYKSVMSKIRSAMAPDPGT